LGGGEQEYIQFCQMHPYNHHHHHG
jgi:hypothetical protein